MGGALVWWINAGACLAGARRLIPRSGIQTSKQQIAVTSPSNRASKSVPGGQCYLIHHGQVIQFSLYMYTSD